MRDRQPPPQTGQQSRPYSNHSLSFSGAMAVTRWQRTHCRTGSLVMVVIVMTSNGTLVASMVANVSWSRGKHPTFSAGLLHAVSMAVAWAADVARPSRDVAVWCMSLKDFMMRFGYPAWIVSTI